MKIKLSIIAIIAGFGAFCAQAQTTDQELSQNISLATSNYTLYPEPTQKLSKAPAGYKAFYMSHYGRHGSRYHYDAKDYANLYNIFAKADSAKVLTPLGKSVLELLMHCLNVIGDSLLCMCLCTFDFRLLTSDF